MTPLILALLACGPKAPPAATAAAPPPPPPQRPMPEPLPASPFVLPTAASATLSNGLPVRVVSNHEVPLFDITLALPVGSWADPAGKEGLLSATFDLMNEGFGGRDAASIARELKRLGGSVSAGVGADGAAVRVSGPVANLKPLLALWADAFLRPDFPQVEWDLMKERRAAAVKLNAEQPTSIASNVADTLAWGAAYRGREVTEATVAAWTIKDAKAAHKQWVVPDGGLLLAGGDLDAATLVPALEAVLASWKAKRKPVTAPTPAPREPSPTAIYLVDKPGAAQSVLRTVVVRGRPTDPTHPALTLGNTVLGGAFTARLNMNLREDKGYTYGARCGISTTLGPMVWSCSASVNTAVTAPALVELRKEIEEILGDRPITADELEFFRSYRIHAFQNSYETPGELLGELVENHRYGLPADRLERYVPDLEAVSLQAAQDALRAYLDPGHIAYVVVGDLATIEADVRALGLPVHRLDRHGNPLAETP